MTSISIEGGAASIRVAPEAPSDTNNAAQQRVAEQEASRQALAARLKQAAETVDREPSTEEVQQAAADLSDYLSSTARSLNIRVDQDLQRPVVTVLDADTEQVVRQIPSEEALAIARFIRSQRDSNEDQLALAGVILNEQG
jgi:flagellar protein FlaG